MESRAPSSFAAPYGHACANCSQSKTKCILRHAGGSCERCHRLNKECRPAVAVRRRNPKRPAISKIVRLEEKLDDIVTLLRAGTQQDATPLSVVIQSTDNSPSAVPQINLHTPTSQSEKGSESSGSNTYVQSISSQTISSKDPPFQILPHSQYDDEEVLLDGEEPSPAEAEVSLVNFLTYKLKHFPLIHIPSTTTARQLQQDRPFLWLCIMATEAKSMAQKQFLGNRIRQTVAREMVVNSEKDIDFLLGLLVFTGWGHYQFRKKTFLSVYTQLAISLVFDLGLNKPVARESKMAITCITLYPCHVVRTPRTMEERRAVLGCYLITSIISTFLQHTDALRWTKHMDECVQVLEEAMECPNDRILLQQVRLQLVADRIHQNTLQYWEVEIEQGVQLKALYREQFRSQLQALKTSILAETPHNETALLHLFSAELESISLPPFPYYDILTEEQQMALKNGLGVVLAWFDTYLSISPSLYSGFSFGVLSQLNRCLTTLSQISTLRYMPWAEDLDLKHIDPVLVLDRIIMNMEQTIILSGWENTDHPGGDIFSRAVQSFKTLRPAFENRISIEEAMVQPGPVFYNGNGNGVSVPDNLGVEFFDNDWLMDLLIYPNY